MQLLVRVMWGNGISWALMLMILSDPQRTRHATSHSVKKFPVPECIVELLWSLPLVRVWDSRGSPRYIGHVQSID